MSSAGIGSLVVRLGLDAAEYTTGLTKSEALAKRWGQQMDRNIAVAIVKAELALQGLAAAGRTAAEVFQTLTTGAADFKDLEETTGASAESIASLAVAAGTAGVSMDDVAGSANKLTKNLVGVDDESKAAGAALKALGLNVEDFKKLDPVGQYEAVGRALAGFADGAAKVAVAQALFGKSGAEQLKVFKALDEAGGRQIILTQAQIEQADAYADAQAKSRTQLRLYAQAAATQALPALTALNGALTDVGKELLGVNAASGQLTANNAIRDFAFDAARAVAVLGESLVGTARLLRAVGGSFQAVAADIALPFKVAAAAAGSEGLSIGERAAGVAKALAERNATVAEANQRYIDLWNYDGTRISDAIRKAQAKSAFDFVQQDPRELARRGRLPDSRPTLSFDGAEKAGKTKADKSSEADRYLDSLLRTLQATNDLTTAEKLLADIQAGRLGKIGIVQQQVLQGVAEEIDATKEAQRVASERAARRKADEDAAYEAARANEQADRDRLKALLANTESEVIKRQQSDIEFLRQAYYDAKISVEDYGAAVAIVMGKAAQETAKASTFADDLGLTFSSAFEDAVVSGEKLSDVLKALEKDITRLVLRELVTKPLAASITSGVQGIDYGAILGSIFGGKKAIGGPTMPGTLYQVGERRPEVYDDGSRQWLLTGSRRGRIDPNPKIGGGSRTINAPISITVPGNTDQRTAHQIGKEVTRALVRVSARG